MATEEQRKEVKEALTFVASVGEGIFGAYADGDFTIGDYKHFIPAVKDLFPAVGGIGVALDGIKNLTSEDMVVYCQHFKEEFDLPDDLLEKFVESCIGLFERFAETVDIFKEWRAR